MLALSSALFFAVGACDVSRRGFWVGDWSAGAQAFGELFEWNRLTLGFVEWVNWGFFFVARK